MRLERLDAGDQVTLRLRALAGGVLNAPPQQGDELRLVFPHRTDESHLGWGDQLVEIEAATDASRRVLTALRETRPPLLCWTAAVRLLEGAHELTVVAHRLSNHVRWESEMPLGVDERVVEQVSKRAGRDLDVEGACAWLAEKTLLPALNGSELMRVVATGTPERGGRFRILGPGVGVDITSQGDALAVDRVVQRKPNQQQFRPPSILLEAGVRYADATMMTGVAPSIRAQLRQIVSDNDASYLALWESYQVIARQQMIRRARRLGWLEYRSYEPLPNGCWAFRAKNKKDLDEFMSRFQSDEQELEAARRPPAEFRDEEEDENTRGGGARAFVGRVDRVRWGQGELHIRPLDEDSDAVPPLDGYLFGAMQGTRTMLRRQAEAVARLKSAGAKMPQLSLLIEGRPAPLRRRHKKPALTAAARAVFKSDPTLAQREALDIALNTPDIALIQGPPGTGKTTVLAALQVRLTNIEAEEEGVAGRTLLSSFQHDAVDNAADRTRVFGLPPARFGARRGSSTVEDQALRWAEEKRTEVMANLAGLDESRPLSLYRRVRDQVALHSAGGLPPDRLRDLLDELLSLPPQTFTVELWERLRELRSPTRRATGTPSFESKQALKAARGLRHTAASFSDDGPYKAQRALTGLDAVLTSVEKALLAEAAEASPDSFSRLDELGALRDALLDRLQPDALPGELPQADPVERSALNEAVAALHGHAILSRGGVADALQEFADALQRAPGEVIRTMRQYSAVFAATCQGAASRGIASVKGLRDLAGMQSTISFENVIVDEAARANPLDLFIPISFAGRRVVLVGDHRQLPHLLEPDIEREVSASAAKEMEEALKKSLFERLFDDLRARERQDGVRRVVTLDQQFRMHPVLGKFVSDVFYKDHGEAFKSPRLADEFGHPLLAYRTASGTPACAAWRNVPLGEGSEKKAGTSWRRNAEATWIAKEVKRLLDGDGADLTVGVITFYSAQVTQILTEMTRLDLAELDPDDEELKIAPEWKTLERPDGSREERLRVGTVDAFQGMEFDVVFLSVVRCNTFQARDEKGRRAKFGHLLLPNRLCVAMSRQKRLLVGVGDRAMFNDEVAAEHVPGLSRFLDFCGGDDGLVA